MSLGQFAPSAFFFDRTVTLLRAASVVNGTPDQYPVDDAAGRADSLVAVSGYAGLSACIQPEDAREVQRYSQRGLNIDTSIYFAQAADAEADDVVQDDGTGRKYLVVAPVDEAEQGRVSWFLCRRLV